MGQSASDVRAGGAYYEMSARDNLTPVLNGLRARVKFFGQFLRSFNPGAGGAGFLNRLVFGAKDADVNTGQYLGRVGGLAAPLRALFKPLSGGLGVIDEWLFGTKKSDAATKVYYGRVGGFLAPLRKMFDSGSRGAGVVNKWLFGDKRFDLKNGGKFVGRIGGLVPLGLGGVGALAGTLKSASAYAASLAAGLVKTGAALAGLGAAAAGGPLALLKGGVDRGANLARDNRKTGLPIETLNKFQYAADRAGATVDEVMQDWTGRYSDLIAQAPPINADDARAAAEAQKDLADATQSLQDAMLPLVSAIAPYVKLLAAWTKDNAHLIAPIGALAIGLGAVGVAAGVAAFAIGGLASIVSTLWSIVTGIGAVLVSPWGLAIAAVAGLTYAFATLTETGRGLTSLFKGELVGAFEQAKSVYGGIADALKKGDLETAMRIATTGIELLWAGTMLRFERGWAGFKRTFVEGWHEITDGLAGPLRAVWDGITTGLGLIWGQVKQIANAIRAAFEWAWDGVREPVLKVLTALKPVGVALAAPFLLAAAAIAKVWDSLDRNLTVNIVTFGAFVERIFARIGAGIENAFKDILREVLAKMGQAAVVLNRIPGAGLDDLIKKIDEVRTGIGTERRDPDKEAKAINDRRDVVLGQLDADRKKLKAEREAGTAAGVAAAETKVADLEKQLEGLNAKAAEPRLPEQPGRDFPLNPNLVPKVSVRGGFASGALGQQLGFGAEVNKQTELLKALVDGQGKLAENIGRAIVTSVRPVTVGRGNN